MGADQRTLERSALRRREVRVELQSPLAGARVKISQLPVRSMR